MMKNLLLGDLVLAVSGALLAGCGDDQTHPSQEILDSMNKQRAAQTQGMNQQGKGQPVPGTPGASNTNPYGNPPAGNAPAATPPATK